MYTKNMSLILYNFYFIYNCGRLKFVCFIFYLYHPDTQGKTKMWISKYGWKDHGTGEIFISNQEDNIKTKNITEKITFDSTYNTKLSDLPFVSIVGSYRRPPRKTF